MSDNKNKFYTIGCKKINKSIKPYTCSRCGCTIEKGSSYYRAFIGKGKIRAELFYCFPCCKDGKTSVRVI